MRSRSGATSRVSLNSTLATPLPTSRGSATRARSSSSRSSLATASVTSEPSAAESISA